MPMPTAGTALNATCATTNATRGVYVKGLGDASAAAVRKLFRAAGAVTDVRLRRKRFALVFFKRATAATKAIAAFHNKMVDGRRLSVATAHAETSRRKSAHVVGSGRARWTRRQAARGKQEVSSSVAPSTGQTEALVSAYAATCLEAMPSTDHSGAAPAFTAHPVDARVAMAWRLPHAVVPQLVAEYVVGPYTEPDWVVVGVTRTGARAAVVIRGAAETSPRPASRRRQRRQQNEVREGPAPSCRRLHEAQQVLRVQTAVRGIARVSKDAATLAALLNDLASAWPLDVLSTSANSGSPYATVVTLWCNLFAAARYTQAFALHTLADVCKKVPAVHGVLCRNPGRDLVFLSLADDLVEGSAVATARCCCDVLFSAEPEAALGRFDDAAFKQASVGELARAFHDCTHQECHRGAFTNAAFRDSFFLRFAQTAECIHTVYWIALSSNGLLGFEPFNVWSDFWDGFFVTLERKLKRPQHQWEQRSKTKVQSADALLDSLKAWNDGNYYLRCFCADDDSLCRAYTDDDEDDDDDGADADFDSRFAELLFAVFEVSSFHITQLIDTYGHFVLCYDDGAYLTDDVPLEYIEKALDDCGPRHFRNDAMVEYMVSAVSSADDPCCLTRLLCDVAVFVDATDDHCGARGIREPYWYDRESESDTSSLRTQVMEWNDAVDTACQFNSCRAVEGIVMPMLCSMDEDRRRVYDNLNTGELYACLTHRFWNSGCHYCEEYLSRV